MANLRRGSGAGSMLLTFLLTGLVGSALGRARPPAEVASSFDLQSSTLTLHEPVFVRFTLRNVSTDVVHVDLGKHRRAGFQFLVTRPDGSVMRVPVANGAGFGEQGRFDLGPGETYVQNLLVNQWYQFAVPGRYKIRVGLLRPLRTESGRTLEASPSGQLSLWVRPRDPGRLEKVCASLAHLASTAPNAQRAWDAAVALSYVDDPVAVRHLADLAGRRGFQWVAVDGLARVAKTEGLQAVTSRLTSKQGRLIPLIEAKLRNIESGAKVAD